MSSCSLAILSTLSRESDRETLGCFSDPEEEGISSRECDRDKDRPDLENLPEVIFLLLSVINTDKSLPINTKSNIT